MASPPAATISSVVSRSDPACRSAGSRVRADSAIRAPASAGGRATAAPMPRLAPVTRATCPAIGRSIGLLEELEHGARAGVGQQVLGGLAHVGLPHAARSRRVAGLDHVEEPLVRSGAAVLR